MSKKQQTYNEALAEIEEIIEKFDNEEYTIDELAEKVKRVSSLIVYCKEKLHATEEEVNNILKNLEKEKGV